MQGPRRAQVGDTVRLLDLDITIEDVPTAEVSNIPDGSIGIVEDIDYQDWDCTTGEGCRNCEDMDCTAPYLVFFPDIEDSLWMSEYDIEVVTEEDDLVATT